MRIEGHVIARAVIFDPRSSPSIAVGMRMLLVMLPEQVLAVVVPVRSPDDRVDVFPIHSSFDAPPDEIQTPRATSGG